VRKGLYLLAALLLIAVIFTGCSKPAKQTGTLTLTFSIPQGTSEYPHFPLLETDRALSRDVGQRPIPSGTRYIDLAVYNETTNWSYETEISVNSGQTTASALVTNIPVGSGYTVEVIPANEYYVAIAMGRADDIVVTSGTNTSVTLTVNKFQINALSYPTTVPAYSLMDVSLSLYSPVSLYSFNIDHCCAVLTDNPTDLDNANGYGLFFDENYIPNFPSNSWVDLDFQDIAPDVAGTWYLYGVGLGYIQPVTDSYYDLVFAFDTFPTIEVTPVDTGGISIIIN
jgi:hypothetical protein